MTEPFDEEPGHGSLGDAMRFVSTVQDWAARTFPASTDGHSSSDCQWCPICQLMSVLRGERPDVTERVAEAGTALASALRAFVDAAMPKAEDSGGQRHRAGERQPRVHRIDLDTDPSDTDTDTDTDPGDAGASGEPPSNAE
ncbi:MAG: hypothetical protein ACRDWT_00945 [Jatrophihabitantaceae bacterium]